MVLFSTPKLRELLGNNTEREREREKLSEQKREKEPM